VKIVCVDNFNREGPGHDDTLVASEITSQRWADIMCEALNKKLSGSRASEFFRVVDDDYELQVFEP
jgi:hypothetical protein